MKILKYTNDWEHDVYTVGGERVTRLETVEIDEVQYPVISKIRSVQYDDMGHVYTATERETLVQNIVKMDKHFRTWTVRRFNINARAVNEINNRAKAQGAKRGQRVEIQL